MIEDAGMTSEDVIAFVQKARTDRRMTLQREIAYIHPDHVDLLSSLQNVDGVDFLVALRLPATTVQTMPDTVMLAMVGHWRGYLLIRREDGSARRMAIPGSFGM